MANKLSKTGITTSATAEAWHVTQSVDALTGVSYDLTLAGTLNLTGSAVTGSISNAVTASYALNAADSAFTAAGISGSWQNQTSSMTVLSSSYATTASYASNAGGSSLWYDGTTYLSSSKDVQITGSLTISGSSVLTLNGKPQINFTTIGSTNTITLVPGTAAGVGARDYGEGNIYIGMTAGSTSATHDGEYNTILGYFAFNNHTNAAGRNIAIGASTLTNCTSDYNIAIGNDALANATTGDKNIGIGRTALYGVGAGSNNIHIGDNIGVASGQTYQLKIGDGSIIAISGSLSTGDIILQNTAVTNLTASADISASGDIIAYNLSASNAFHATAHGGFEFTIDGAQFNMYNQTADKHMFFLTTAGAGALHFGTSDQNSQFVVGTGGHITASADISASGTIYGDILQIQKGATFNVDQSPAYDFKIRSQNKNYMFYVDANVDRAGIGYQSPNASDLSSSLHINGDLTTDSHITASGNISASGDLIGNNITASSNISASGEFIGATGSFSTLELGGGSAGIEYTMFPGFSSHSGTGATTILTIPTDSAYSYTVTATIIGSTGVPKAVGGQLIGVFNNNGGTVSLIGTQNQYIAETETGSPSFDFAVSGGNILIQVTNGSVTTYKWSAHAKYIKVQNAL